MSPTVRTITARKSHRSAAGGPIPAAFITLKAAITTEGSPTATVRRTRGLSGATVVYTVEIIGATATTTVVISTRMSTIMVVIIIACMGITIFVTGITAIGITIATGAESLSASASHFNPLPFSDA